MSHPRHILRLWGPHPLKSPLVSWTRAHSGTTVVLLRSGVLFGPLAPRDHIRVRIAYRDIQFSPLFLSPGSCFVDRLTRVPVFSKLARLHVPQHSMHTNKAGWNGSF